ncbi:unnamed protein product [Trichobilharzia szidati]|nr:unnamed protein product [Trichobilharzia szidati]
MPRGRGVKRGHRQTSSSVPPPVVSKSATNNSANADEETSEVGNTKAPEPGVLVPCERKKRKKEPKIENEEDDESEDYEFNNGVSGKRVKEGNIDVDDGESQSAVDEAVEEETDDTLTPAEKASQVCRLPAKELCKEETLLFPFLESSPNSLRQSYIIVRNFACLMWSEDSCIQVTPNRLFTYVVNNMSMENLKVMIDSGLTAPLPSQHQGSNSSASSVCEENLHNSGRNKNRRKRKRSFQRHPPTLSLPNNYSPWGTSIAKANLERMCYLVVLFLERYGYVNFGVFKIISPPLTHVSTSRSTASTHTTPMETEKPEVHLTPRRAAAEKALAATRRTSASPNNNSVTVNSSSSASSSSLSTSSASSSSSVPHFIIIGAGISGLIAARQLTYFGAKVTIFESRDRVGGRIWTYRKNGCHAELGAMVVTGLAANPVTVLVRQLSLNLLPINTECSLYGPQGHPINHDIDEEIEEEFNRLLGTAAYICHNKGIDSKVLDSGAVKHFSLGQMVEILIEFQERHERHLNISHRKLLCQLLDRRNVILDQMVNERKNIEAAFEKWHTASTELKKQEKQQQQQQQHQQSKTSSNNNNNNNNNNSNNTNDTKPRARPDSASCSPRSSNNTEMDGVKQQTSTSGRGTESSASANESRKLTDKNSQANETSESCKSPTIRVFNVSAHFEVRQLLCQLHRAWKQFQPLEVALAKVNKQFDVLFETSPKDAYLTEDERCVLDWHLANLEFANATELHNLSLRHWDQDDLFEFNGEHCVLQDGYGSVTDNLAQYITSGQTIVSHASTSSSSSSRHRDHQTSVAATSSAASTTTATAQNSNAYKLGPCHIELKSAAKRISYSNTGVRVDVLNTAFSQDDLIEYDADAVLCTLPLGILKESIRLQQPTSNTTNKSNNAYLTKLIAPCFEPPLPDWKIAAIQRLGYGLLNKVVLIFEKCFWDRSQNLFGHVNSSTKSRGELFLFWSITDKPVLIALVAGRAACDLEGSNEKPSPTRRISPGSKASGSSTTSATSAHANANNHLIGRGVKEPIVSRAMQILRGIFGQENTGNNNGNNNNGNGVYGNSEKKKVAVPNPIDAYVTRWKADPDSRGSYSYVAVGATGADYDILGEPVSVPSPPSTTTTTTTSSSDVIAEKRSRNSAEPVQQQQQQQDDSSGPTARIPRVFFAGEHTCRCYPATVHGALLSGLREAARIANNYFPGPTPIRVSGFKLLNNST